LSAAPSESFRPAGASEAILASVRALGRELRTEAPQLLPRLAVLLPDGDLDGDAAADLRPEAEAFFPDPDYDRHPYYRDFASSGAMRDQAAERFFAAFTALVQAELALAFRAERSAAAAPASPGPGLKALQDDGIWRFRLTPSELAETLERTEPAARALEDKRRSLGPSQRGVEGVLQLLAEYARPDAELEFYQGLLKSHGVYETLQQYYGCPVRLLAVNLQINSGDDTGIGRICSYPDGRRAPSYYMHIDSAVGVAKILMYRSGPTTADNGAFRYLPGSHRALDPVRRAIRKACDKAGLDGLKDESRALFMGLPPALRHKANYGNDLLPETGIDASALLDREVALEGQAGEGFLTDVNGAHRGNLHADPSGRREMFKFVLKAGK
jgi:hypothetical protein